MRLLKESLNKNENISLHEAIIEQGSEENLRVFIIFPRAPFGDLWQFLHGGKAFDDSVKSYDFASRFPKAVDDNVDPAPALLKQCRDLAGALKFLHKGFPVNNTNFFCAHMDLKPNNILIFDGGSGDDAVGKWKLCDFGISAFKESERPDISEVLSVGDYHAQNTMNTKARRDPGPYQAPEVWQLQDTVDASPQAVMKRGKVGRKSDIWSFGAILAEVLTFALIRDTGVKDFEDYRLSRPSETGYATDYFYTSQTIKTDKLVVPGQSQTFSIQVKPQVLIWLERLCADSSTPQRWADCWAECIRRILQVDPDERPSARLLKIWVDHVHDHASNSTQAEDIDCIFSRSTSQRSPMPQRQPPRPPRPPPPPSPPLSLHNAPDLPEEAPSPQVSIYNNPRMIRITEQSQVQKLGIGCRKAVAVATDGVRIAYLTKSSIVIFQMLNLEESREELLLPDDISCPGWKGIAIAGDYVALWGLGRRSAESLVRLYSPTQLFIRT
jgi:serine/threonine protein kinase